MAQPEAAASTSSGASGSEASKVEASKEQPAAATTVPVVAAVPAPPAPKPEVTVATTTGAPTAPVTPAAEPVPVVPMVVAPSPAPAREATAVGGAITTPPAPAVEAPPVTEIGIERLPGSAYPEPQTRGLKYGSLWLTFHGLQWPYMPAGPKGERFVIGISGWGWVDTAYEKFSPWGNNSAVVSQDNNKYWKQQSRLLVRITPTYSFGDDMFLQGQVEMVGTGDQTINRGDVGGADTDDLYLRFGKWNKWDLQVGRYEGWEVFHLGMGLDQNTFERIGAVSTGDQSYPIQFYGLTDNQFRPAGSAGNLAFHYYPLSILRFEMLTMAGTLSGLPTYATRPVAILDLGWLKLKGGLEYQHQVAQQATNQTERTSKGVGGAVQFVFEPHIEFGLNVAQGTVESQNGMGQRDPTGSYTRTSLGGFANVSNGSAKHPIIFGVGSLWTRTVDQNNLIQSSSVVDNYWLLQNFVAVQYVAFNQLYIKLVGGYSRGHWVISGQDPPQTWNDEMYSVRLRFSMYF
ncbi:MAG TPA: hypothetical protein VGP07_12825 [Polyangia bacterium]